MLRGLTEKTMAKKIFVFLMIINLLASLGQAQTLSKKQISQGKQAIARSQQEIARLKAKLAKTKDKKTKIILQDKIQGFQAKVAATKKKIYPKKYIKSKKNGHRPNTSQTSAEALSEEILASSNIEEDVEGGLAGGNRNFRLEIGSTTGLLAGTTALLGELRLPMRWVVGPATTSLRLTSGLSQNWESNRRFLPIGVDLIFNLPPGTITGVYNYIGLGLNYLLVTTGRLPGSIGGELFYGVESDGFGGKLFGELGYAALSSSTSSQVGTTVMVGFRKNWLF